MREIAWKNADGMLLGARVHDARLISLEFANRHYLLLTFRRVDGTAVKLSYEGVQEICLGQIWNDSIVNDIFIWDVGNVPPSQMVDVGWNALFQGRAGSQYFKENIRNIMDRDTSQFLSVIGFVHGTSTAVVCKTLHIAEF
ncbi:hypothetical protein [Rhizobium sp. P28RR-XV]|uniref:hypothetical protein n=1 Tax=Rhizobium sp. P28RR-XV TaxID=2726737 RepID=UPI0014573D7F|nr:hypothetical protein [Rhizobium sp. P28RR-XV]NLR88382.1 hypothetical protein [Rhizobium sp. P28RR-XV]